MKLIASYIAICFAAIYMFIEYYVLPYFQFL